MITYDDFSKLDIRVGTVVSAEKIPDADRLLKLRVDIGEGEPRTLVAGIASFITPEEIVGKQIPILANLEHRTIRGIISEGMILAASAGESFSLLETGKNLPNGSIVK